VKDYDPKTVWVENEKDAQKLANALIDEGWVDELSDTREMLKQWLLGESD
jgi:hypothetical protein